MIYDNVLSLIGNTPVIRMDDISGNTLFLKLEYFSPTGSIKDRAAYYMINKMLERGELEKGGTVIEATSGNTGIGMSIVAVKLGLKAIIVMPENMSVERIKYIRSLGAEVVLTDKALGMSGASERAEQLRQSIKGSKFLKQFSNADNQLAHYETTAVEIFRDVPDLDIFVYPVGSGGTIMGISRYIRDNGLKTKVIAVEPKDSPLLSRGTFGAHLIQGIGANQIPENIDKNYIDDYILVSNEEAYNSTVILNRKYGITSGISGGCAFAACQKLNQRGKKVLTIIPDNSLRYLSVENLF